MEVKQTRWKFEMWAPEIPVMAIEGDQARRRWQWQLADVPVKLDYVERVREALQSFSK